VDSEETHADDYSTKVE